MLCATLALYIHVHAVSMTSLYCAEGLHFNFLSVMDRKCRSMIRRGWSSCFRSSTRSLLCCTCTCRSSRHSLHSWDWPSGNLGALSWLSRLAISLALGVHAFGSAFSTSEIYGYVYTSSWNVEIKKKHVDTFTVPLVAIQLVSFPDPHTPPTRKRVWHCWVTWITYIAWLRMMIMW